MARKNIVPSFKMLDAADISTNVTSEIVNVQNQDKGSIRLDWTGTVPVGEITVEARNGENEEFFILDMGAIIDISGNTGDHHLVFTAFPFTDIRLQYTATSGSGNLDAVVTLQQAGG